MLLLLINHLCFFCILFAHSLEELNIQHLLSCSWRCLYFSTRSQRRGQGIGFLLLKHKSWRWSVAFQLDLCFFAFKQRVSTENCAIVKFWQWDLEVPFFLNQHCLFLHPSLNQLYSSHGFSLYDSSEISTPLSAMISSAFSSFISL